MRLLVAIVGMMVLAVPLQAGAARLETSDLDASPVTWNGQSVTIQGEVIGDYGRRSEVVWVQVNDDDYVDAPLVETGELAGTNTGMGVRIPNELFDETWGRPGGYRTRGPVLEVTGVFRYADADTGGDTFIDATSIELISPSRALETRSADWTLVTVSLLAGATGLALGARSRWRRLNPEA